MKQKMKMNLHNRFDIEVRDAGTGELKQKAYAENIILNQAWAQILVDGQDWFDHIKIGTGTGTIAASRTTLFTQLLTRLATDSVWSGDMSENWYSHRQKVVLIESEYVGSVITEVGIGPSTVLCTHALLKDMNGNQVAITKTSLDIITVYATVYLRISGAWSKTAAIDVARIKPDTNPLVRILLGRRMPIFPGAGSSRVLNYPSYMCASANDAFNQVTSDYPLTVITKTFDVPNKKLTLSHRIPAASANVGGLKSYILGSKLYGDYYDDMTFPCMIAHLLDSVITQALIVEQIGTGNDVLTDFATTFPFVKSGAVIKVDGSVVSPLVLTELPKVKDIKGYMYNLGNTGNGEFNVTDLFPSGTNAHDLILENPFYAAYGIDSVAATNVTLYTSDDMTTWTQVYTGSGTYTVAAGHKQKRYWKATKEATAAWRITAINCDAFDALKNVLFAAAPANGAVITAEYDADVAAKDVNHVYDVTVVLQFGEYTP